MKKTIIGYIILTFIIIFLLIVCVFFSKVNYKTENLLPYELNEEDVQEYDISKFTEYELIKQEFYTYDEYEATVNFDRESMYSIYELSESNLSLGQIITVGDYLGKSLTAENVFSSENGRIVDINEGEKGNNILTVLNANSFHILVQMPQEYFNSIDYTTIMRGVFSNGKEIDLKIKKITYEVSNGKIPIELTPVKDSFDVFPGTIISVRNNFKKSECNFFINYNAFLIEGKYSYAENTYFEFIIKRFNNVTNKFYYTKEFIKTGKKIDNYVELYFYEDNCTFLVKR